MILNPAIEAFLLELLPPRHPVLREMEECARDQNIPIVGPLVGNFLAQLVRISGARRIFELGSAIGYSTAWLALAAGEGAEVHYTDRDSQRAATARGYFERLGVADRVVFHIGDALESLERTSGDFDFIFNDISKDLYPRVLDIAVPRLRAGGLLVSDNALWHERVLAPEDPTARIVREFNFNSFRNKDLHCCLVPLRDGLLIAWKRGS